MFLRHKSGQADLLFWPHGPRLGNLELALRRGTDEGIRRYLEGATHAAQRGAKITSQLLAFSRTQRSQTEPMDLNSIVTRIGDLLLRTIGATVQIKTVLENNLWQATADPRPLVIYFAGQAASRAG
jgi:signal transduction histidine kinase